MHNPSCSQRLLRTVGQMKVKGRLTLSRLGKAELSENTLYRRLSLGGDIAGLHNKIDKCKNKPEMEPLGVISGQPLGRKKEQQDSEIHKPDANSAASVCSPPSEQRRAPAMTTFLRCSRHV